MTPAESYLWSKINKGQLDGRKFRRQHGVGKYILGFYCPSEKLSVELDGMNHFSEEAMEYDKNRTDYLSTHNIRVIRFENAEVFDMTEEVLSKIKACFK